MTQYSSVLLCVLVAIASRTFGAPLDDSAIGDCPGGLANGALLERGRFFYECRDGSIVPKGCLSDALKRVPIGGTADRLAERRQCILGGEGLLTFEPIACLQNGAEHKIGDQWEDGNNFYICKKTDNNELRSVNSGCVEQGKRIALGDKVSKEDFVFVCNSTVNNGAHLMPSACVKEGKEHNVGDSFEIGQFWFNCVRIGRERLAVKAAGCVANGKRLSDGDRVTENEVISECTIDTGKNELRAVACAQRDENGGSVERKLGCTWVEGQAPFQYEWACQRDASGNSVQKVQLRCNYNAGGGAYVIEPGCYRAVDKTAIGCLKEASGLKLQSFQGDNAEKSASAAGLRSC